MNKNIKVLITVLIISIILLGCSNITKAESVKTINTQNKIETYFTKKDGNLDQILIKEINTAQKNLNVSIYSLTKENIGNAIISAKKRGVEIKIITDKQESQSKSQKAILDKLKANNIPVKINSHPGLMHLKLTIVDNKTVCGGSYNYTANATEKNDENLIIMRDSNMVNEYINEFNAMWNDTNNYADY
ncbi:phospholipase D-like domain-containing protein [Clostridium saccharoperbutylacetonicum]|uniref:phospholipase D-like domain-containing protein n=1 Tax=Clostridium saccharoperbutylacetonicum TaxID=36745 RepID=UPI0039EA58AC